MPRLTSRLSCFLPRVPPPRTRSLQLIAVRPNGSSIRVNTVAIMSRPRSLLPREREREGGSKKIRLSRSLYTSLYTCCSQSEPFGALPVPLRPIPIHRYLPAGTMLSSFSSLSLNTSISLCESLLSSLFDIRHVRSFIFFSCRSRVPFLQCPFVPAPHSDSIPTETIDS
jgi:hypothetical protein